jgi:hypothetical protein
MQGPLVSNIVKHANEKKGLEPDRLRSQVCVPMLNHSFLLPLPLRLLLQVCYILPALTLYQCRCSPAGQNNPEERHPQVEPEHEEDAQWMFNVYDAIQGMYSFFFYHVYSDNIARYPRKTM